MRVPCWTQRVRRIIVIAIVISIKGESGREAAPVSERATDVIGPGFSHSETEGTSGQGATHGIGGSTEGKTGRDRQEGCVGPVERDDGDGRQPFGDRDPREVAGVAGRKQRDWRPCRSRRVPGRRIGGNRGRRGVGPGCAL